MNKISELTALSKIELQKQRRILINKIFKLTALSKV